MKPPTLKEALKGKLSDKELEFVTRAYDIVGDIAIIDISKELVSKEKIIGETLLSIHKNINVVLKRGGIHEGEFRTQKMEFLAGENRKDTEYKENGCRLFLNVEKCYFSSRSSNERKRVAGLVSDGEEVLVMFSGIAPFPLVISKMSNAKRIVGVEKNPISCKYADMNVLKNKVKNVELFCGDVYDILPNLGVFDRVFMPLPKSGEDFLNVALDSLRTKGWLHFYDFQNDKEFEIALEKVVKGALTKGRKVLEYNIVKCGQYAPHVFRICVDARIG